MLSAGRQARVVNVGTAPLRARRGPSVSELAVHGFSAGAIVNVVEGPVEADGYTWWRLEDATGNGWSAERSADGIVWLEAIE